MSGQNQKNRKNTASGSKKGKTTAKNTKANTTTGNDSIYQEVILWVMLAVSLVLFVSNFGIGGKVGDLLSSFLFGVCGLLAYIFPILLFVGTVFVLSNRNNCIAVIKVVAAVLFVCFLCLFLELVSGVTEDYSPVNSYMHGVSERNGGGFLGGLFAWLICPNFGRISAYVIDFIVLIITMVVVTERSAWKHVQKGGQRVYESAKVSNERLHEMQVQRREERALRRMERKVSGVSADTKLSSDKEVYVPTDALTEITPESYAHAPEIFPSADPQIQASVLGAADAGGVISAAEPQVTEKHQVNLQPVSESEATPQEDPVPVFSPELQELFAQVDTEVLPPDTEVSPAEELPSPAHVSSAPVRNTKMNAAEAQEELQSIAEEIEQQACEKRTYVFPPTDLLKKGNPRQQGDSKQHLQQTAMKLQQTLKNFGVNVTISNVSCGPTVTRYEIQPEMGVKVSKIVNLTDDIKLNLAAADIRMEAPIPGKAAIGIEVPNKETLPVMLRDLLESEEFKNHPSDIAFAAGRDIGGQVIMADIAKMPHLLIAGATGSGKSVCINTIIMSLLYRADPEDVKLILIDPKVVELSVYNGIPHLFIPVVTDPKKAAGALNWAVAEMTERYQKFATYGVRDLKGYNAKVESIADINDPEKPEKLPQIVIIVDELADLMMVAPGDVEDAICRLAQLARACGIHLIIATQRPSVNVITGLIKANMPSRIAFSVTSGVDSRTILDMVGAEKLLGKGDCLYYPQGLNKPLRVQGAFVSDQEVANVVDFIKESYGQASYDNTIEEKMNKISESTGGMAAGNTATGGDADGRDAYFVDAAKLLMDKDKASIGMLQRYFKIGFNRAARIMDQLEEAGVVGPEEGTKPRQILMSPETFDALLEDGSF